VLNKDYEIFELGDWPLVNGETLQRAQLAYTTHGTLNATKDNAIVFPTAYGGTHRDEEYMIGEGKALDPTKYFIVQINLFGNGLSSSPSNTQTPQDKGRFPKVTIYDNVRAQHKLVTEGLGIERLALVCGFSMGAIQTFQWAAAYPEMVVRMAPWCGTATTTVHNRVFLEGMTAAIRADAAWNHGDYEEQPTVGLKTIGRAWAGWGLSPAFYNQQLYLEQGYPSIEDYIVRDWEDSFASQDANDLLALAYTWQSANVGMTPGCDGNKAKALGRITAKACVIAGQTDMYFPPEDIKLDASHIKDAEFLVIPSILGHQAGAGANPADVSVVDRAITNLLSR
jgi:homoserine O-acetyltransferase